ncbi:MAG: sigma 54-interacting transcriptional regulator [candidate division Zixibacteria bacterium]|nr:sigma 54-interacting transcriptional regulator [Candidatus Tariuqbacter arcticus]
MREPDILTAILDSITDGVFTVDKDWLITSFNYAAEKITGVPREEAVGRHCYDVFRTNICETGCALRKTMSSVEPIVNKAVYIINSRGERVPITISTAPLKDKRGRIIGGVETFRDLSRVEQLQKELENRYTFEDIISKSPKFRRIFAILPTIADSDSTVLLQGESGTGKELLARAIHSLSPRRNKPMVTVNCGALPDSLLESELFGYKAGAFTDAKRDKPGRFALAEGGAVFLDEIGDISPALQVKLLRVLQDRTYEPLGGIETKKADVRIITASNRNLEELVKSGKFRDDLFYRINVINIIIPPLRERKEDIPLLVEHFIGKFNKLQGRDIADIAPEVMSALMNHDYPGNVRELENIIEHGFVLCPGRLISVEHLPDNLRGSDVQPGVQTAETLEDVEAQFIESALRRNNWNRLKTAQELGMHKTTLFRKIKRYGIVLPAVNGRTNR